LDQCLNDIDTLREYLQESVSSRSSLRAKLKLVQREYKVSVKEMHTVRQTLKSLQSVKL
jgi:septation ring formation regulator EzrA